MRKNILALMGISALMASQASASKLDSKELNSLSPNVTAFRSYGGNGMYFPSKHPIQSYAAQNRAAKKRRRAK